MARPPSSKRTRLLAVGLSLAAHLAIPLAMLSFPAQEPERVELDPVVVSLVNPVPPPPPPPPPEPAPDPGGSPAPTPMKAAEAPPRRAVRPAAVPPPPEVTPLMVSLAETPEPALTVGEAELAGARTAGSGDGGSGTGSAGGVGAGSRPCDMVRRLQEALRKDADVRAAITEAHRDAGAGRRALVVWNGDWVRSRGQEGKGLAGVRQAIILEVAFAPEACRTEPVSGLVLISMSDGPGAARVVLGSGTWRWSDLLSARRR